MNDVARVWLSSRKCKRKTSYHLRWYDPSTGKMRSRVAGTDKKRAEREAMKLEQELEKGTYRDVKRIPWKQFSDEVASYLDGEHAVVAKRTLKEFGEVCKPITARNVRPSMVRAYVEHCKGNGNAVATINKKLRYLRLAFNEAIRLDYASVNPLGHWNWQRESKREIRTLSADEEVKLLASCEALYGFKMTTFVRFLLETWARYSEATKLRWEDVLFEEGSVCFRDTKSNEDRFVPIDNGSSLLSDLRRLKAKTMKDGGPFRSLSNASASNKKWYRILGDAGIKHITRHDLRRTGITRALVNGMPPTLVMKMAGHQNMATTMKYYAKVTQDDLRKAVAKLHATVG